MRKLGTQNIDISIFIKPYINTILLKEGSLFAPEQILKQFS